MDDFDRKWKMIQDQLAVQISGEQPRRVSSGRTLFGIRSSVEEKMEAVAKEVQERNSAACADDSGSKPK